MATRILTLFDEEDFFQEETPAAQPAKPAATATDNMDDAAVPAEKEEDPAVIKEEASQEITDIAPVAEPGSVEAAVTADAVPEEEATADAVADQTPEAPEPEEETPVIAEAAIAPEPALPQDDTDAGDDHTKPLPAIAAIDEVPEQERIDPARGEEAVRTADEVLNKQMLTELIQLDYTTLIHKEYPFDLHKAQVITKEKEIAAPALIETAATEEETQEEDEVFEEIVPLPEWNLDKKYYTIGEVAQLFAVNTSHIRFWTNEFKLKPRTTRKGDRLYNPKDIAELRLIHHLVKEKKHTIKGAREKLKAEKTGVGDKLDLKESLTGLRDILLQIKEQL